ncbi:MAG: hypothetical protein H6716_25240 [Polyangiaceae bacterium]|nr:hypothetical protein [Polyangiaceae bacterium]
MDIGFQRARALRKRRTNADLIRAHAPSPLAQWELCAEPDDVAKTHDVRRRLAQLAEDAGPDEVLLIEVASVEFARYVKMSSIAAEALKDSNIDLLERFDRLAAAAHRRMIASLRHVQTARVGAVQVLIAEVQNLNLGEQTIDVGGSLPVGGRR